MREREEKRTEREEKRTEEREREREKQGGANSKEHLVARKPRHFQHLIQ
jgi:hypothetical protein